MNKWILPGAIAAVLFLAVAGGAFALTGGLDDDDDGQRQSTLADGEEGDLDGDAARCAEGATDCDDTAGGDALGVCISEDDPLYDPEQPCNDMVVDDGDGDGSLNMCIAGATDCVDTPADGGQEPVTSIDGIDPDECNEVHNITACEVKVHEIVIVDMETNIGSVATIVSSEFVQWPNACLGVETEGVACTEVITSGFKVIAEAGGTQVEYHTDLKGGFVIAN